MAAKRAEPAPEQNQMPNSPPMQAGNALGDAVAKAAEGLGVAIAEMGTVATQASQTVAEATGGTVEALEAAMKLGQTATVMGAIATEAIGSAATQVGAAAGKQGQEWFEQATEEAGKAIGFWAENPVLKPVLKFVRAEWLLALAGGVDVAKVEAKVRTLQQEYPQETPRQIAHRIIVDKAMYAGGIGLVSSVLPGVALALLAVDLVATTQLQAEMVYEIAAAYGKDLQLPARRGEVLAIFGLSLGGSEAAKAGLGLLRNVPLAGMAIGASTNAALMYALGYAACRFYESPDFHL
ncbi:MAG: hypothetical protein ACM37W_24650 [Actinomycetota bacterium]